MTNKTSLNSLSLPAILVALMGLGIAELTVLLTVFYIPSFFFFRKFFRKRTSTQQNAVALSLVVSFFVSILLMYVFSALLVLAVA